MIEYNYFEDLSLTEVNSLGNQDWEVVGVAIKSPPTPPTYDIFVKRGRQGIEIIEVDSSAHFFIDKSFSLGESVIIIFATMLIFIILSKMIYGWLFEND